MDTRPARLRRSVSGFGAIIFALTWISPAWAVFVGAPVLIQQTGSFVIGAILITAVIGIAVACNAAEVVSAFAHAGGDVAYAGAVLGPSARFIVVALVAVSNTASLGLLGLGVASAIQGFAPGFPLIPGAMASVMVAAGIAAMSTRVNMVVTGLFVILELVAVMATGALGFLHPHQDLVQVIIHPVVGKVGGGLQTPSIAAMGMAIIPAIGILNGYTAAAGLPEETIGIRRKLPGIILIALALGVLFILPPLAGIIIGTPDLGKLSRSETPVQDFILQHGGRGALSLISASVALALFNSMIASMMGTGRILYASARDRIFHRRLNPPLASVHPTFGSPWAATLVVGVFSVPFCLVPAASLVIFGSSAVVVFYAFAALEVIIGRRTGATRAATYRAPLHPLAPIVVLAVAAALFLSALADPGPGRLGVLAAAAAMLAGLLCYWLVVRPRGAWAAYHPEPDDEPSST